MLNCYTLFTLLYFTSTPTLSLVSLRVMMSHAQFVLTALAGNVLRSVVSVRLSLRLFSFYLLNQLTSDLYFLHVYGS